ncbi:Stp1/IreP family PP2C-type Ser/Thr phosphatase [Alkalibacterium putridalgicola]|uniref:Stp1/IreP family PP2C-type Ser/Thr phosphatase n=1 Tax=Alkalibacterium putridalgicola TaxID=426703 RepID=UPI0024822F77|nr:Stp1/IreP family PP2C-type Ser/Thr phosphatase [Alkalibacterium putridalgicola]
MGKRSINQDYVETFLNKDNQLLAVLCDGMGGHKAGDIASEMAVLQIGNHWKETAFSNGPEASEWLDQHINLENQRIYRIAKTYSDLDGMGTTLVTSAFINDEIVVGNVGDSRAYYLDQNGLELVTEDHSFANELRLKGEISDEEARNHRQRHTLTRSLGVFDKVAVDFFYLKQTDDSLLMLCSDGLSNGVDQPLMDKVLRGKRSLSDKANIMTEYALQNGSTDNITMCLIENKSDSTDKGKEDE